MSDVYRRITAEEWEAIPRHERAGYVTSDRGHMFVKVEPCEHDNYERHPIAESIRWDLDDGIDWYWCDGQQEGIDT